VYVYKYIYACTLTRDKFIFIHALYVIHVYIVASESSVTLPKRSHEPETTVSTYICLVRVLRP